MSSKVFSNCPNTNISLSRVKYQDIPTNTIFRIFNLIFRRKAAVGTDNFFNYKKKKLMLVWLLVFVVIIILTTRFFLGLSIFKFFSELYSRSNTPYFLLTLIFGFLTLPVCDILMRVHMVRTHARGRLKGVSKFEWFRYSIVSGLLQTITPFSVGSEPYSIWWLNRRGISLKESSAIVSVSSFCWFVGQFVVTWPSFIYLSVQHSESISNLTITGTYWASLVGLCVDICVALFIFGISYFAKMHYFISTLINRIKKMLDMPYLSRESIAFEYLENNTFQRIYLSYLKTKTTPRLILACLACNLWVYILFVASFRIFKYSEWGWQHAINAYNIINISTTANNFLPLPSAEGSLQVVIRDLLSSLDVSNNSNKQSQTNNGIKDAVDNAVFLWRIFTKYLSFMIGMAFIFICGFNDNLTARLFRNKNSDQSDLKLTF